MKKYLMFQISVFCMILGFVSPSLAFDAESVKIHGFLSQGFLQTDHNNFLAETEDGTFQFNEFGINFSTQLTDKLQAGVQFFGRDMGSVGNDEVRLDWAFMNYRWKDWAGVKIGRMKMIYGLYNDVREIDMLRTSVLLPQSVYVEVYRDSMSAIKGVDFYGSYPVKYLGRFGYELQYGVLPFSEGDGVSQAIENANAAYKLQVDNIDSDYAYAYGLTWDTPLDGLRFRYSGFEVNGLAASGGANVPLPNGTVVNSFNLDYNLVRFFVGSGEYTLGDFTLASEYMEMDLRATNKLGPITSFRNTPYQGWYVAGSYRFNDVFTLGLSYSEFYNDSNDKDGDKQVAAGKKDYQTWLKTYTVSTRFNINDFWLLKLEASYNDGFGGVQPVYNAPVDLEPYWWLFAAKATVSF